MAEPHLPLRQWFLNPGDHRPRLLGRVGGWKVTESWVTLQVLGSGAKAEAVCPKHGQRDSPGRSDAGPGWGITASWSFLKSSPGTSAAPNSDGVLESAREFLKIRCSWGPPPKILMWLVWAGARGNPVRIKSSQRKE